MKSGKNQRKTAYVTSTYKTINIKVQKTLLFISWTRYNAQSVNNVLKTTQALMKLLQMVSISENQNVVYDLSKMKDSFFFFSGKREDDVVNAGMISIKYQYVFTSTVYFVSNFMMLINFVLGQYFYLTIAHRAMHLLSFIFQKTNLGFSYSQHSLYFILLINEQCYIQFLRYYNYKWAGELRERRILLELLGFDVQ